MSSDVDPDSYLTLGKAAGLAGVSRTTLLRRIYAGRLQYIMAGKYYLTTLRWVSESDEPGAMGRPPKRLPDNLRPAPGRPKPPRPTRGRKGGEDGGAPPQKSETPT